MVIITCSNPYDFSDLAGLSIDISSETLDVVVRVDTSAVADVFPRDFNHLLCNRLDDRISCIRYLLLRRRPRKVNCDGLFVIAYQLQRQYLRDQHQKRAWIQPCLFSEVILASDILQRADYHVSDERMLLAHRAFRPSCTGSSASASHIESL